MGTGVGVGLGVGVGAGVGLGTGVGVGTGRGTGVAVGSGVSVGTGSGISVGSGCGSSVGMISGVSVGSGVGMIIGSIVGSGIGSSGISAGFPVKRMIARMKKAAAVKGRGPFMPALGRNIVRGPYTPEDFAFFKRSGPCLFPPLTGSYGSANSGYLLSLSFMQIT